MVDVYLVSGFLGSGKTTLLVRLLNDAKKMGKKPAVFMNEFGSMNIDTQTITTADGDIPMREMLEGCICCTGSEQTEAQIQTILVEHPTVDTLFIETTGAAHPVEALDAIFSPLFAERLSFKGIITVLDVKRYLEMEHLSIQMRALFMEQIRHAHFIVGNKTDLLTADELALLSYRIQPLVEGRPFVQTTEASVHFQDIQKQLDQPIERQKSDFNSHIHHALQSKTIRMEQPVHRGRFEEWVQSLPDHVYRMKGYLYAGGNKPESFQYSYGMTRWMPEYVKMEPVLVIIGEDIQQIECPDSVWL